MLTESVWHWVWSGLKGRPGTIPWICRIASRPGFLGKKETHSKGRQKQ